ncbi:MAG: thioesterase family protein [Nocardioides sp.]|uniref:thioesterase family protein n=1 Tax=Nocardioides sp. TaxID=35761 RepID=UPI0039E2EF74
MTIAEFDRDIEVWRAAPDAPGASDISGAYDAELPAGWVVGGGVNGGFLLAVVGSAVRAQLPDKPDPVTMSAAYCSAARPGPAQVRIRVRRDGGSLAVVTAELWQPGERGDELRLTTLSTYGDLARLHATANPFERVGAVEPALPARAACLPATAAPDAVRRAAPMMARFEMLFPPDQAGFAVGRPTHRGELSAWFRHHDRDPDPIALLQVLDALPPVTFDLGMPGWAPTLELTCHLRHRPAPGWLKVRHETRNVSGGMFEEDCEIWDSAGRLVAQSRQLARLPRAE